jgi:hypothetical protein
VHFHLLVIIRNKHWKWALVRSIKRRVPRTRHVYCEKLHFLTNKTRGRTLENVTRINQHRIEPLSCVPCLKIRREIDQDPVRPRRRTSCVNLCNWWCFSFSSYLLHPEEATGGERKRDMRRVWQHRGRDILQQEFLQNANFIPTIPFTTVSCETRAIFCCRLREPPRNVRYYSARAITQLLRSRVRYASSHAVERSRLHRDQRKPGHRKGKAESSLKMLRHARSREHRSTFSGESIRGNALIRVIGDHHMIIMLIINA